MNKFFGYVILLCISMFLVACTNNDESLNSEILEKYSNEFSKNGYVLNEVDATNNVSGWLEITDKDVISVHRTHSDNEDGVAYLYLFKSASKAEKMYEKILDEVKATNYQAYLDGNYVIVALGKLNEIIDQLNS